LRVSISRFGWQSDFATLNELWAASKREVLAVCPVTVKGRTLEPEASSPPHRPSVASGTNFDSRLDFELPSIFQRAARSTNLGLLTSKLMRFRFR
jgi:hypothetical protein